MKNLFLLFIVLAYAAPSFSSGFDVIYDGEAISETEEDSDYVWDPDKREFKKRKSPIKSFKEALRIEANFKVPIRGKDTYFGRIYLTKDTQHIKYRDELVAEEFYSKEKADDKIFYSTNYKVSDINSNKGLSLVDGAGASVTLRSPRKNFNTRTGGELILNVKHPFDGKFSLNVKVIVNSSGNSSTTVNVDGRSVAFDTLKINAAGFGITAGIKNVEFYNNGRLVETINP